MTLRSPNEMLAAAKEQMLDGREPTSRRDWQLVFNFLAFHIMPEAQPACLYLLRVIYNVPLTELEIDEISKFQISCKEKEADD